jgi:hypothetical protein
MLTETDPILESLRDELRSVMAALNDLHHPVYGGGARQVAELEARVADLRTAMAARKLALVASR